MGGKGPKIIERGIDGMELLDIYDADGRPTGRIHQRGTPFETGEFGLATVVVIYDSRGRIFCTRRSPEKKLAPNMWESPGGSVLAGETGPQGAVRELREETGLAAREDELVFVTRRQLKDVLLDTYALHRDFSPDQVVFQPGETVDGRWFPLDEWERLARSREILAGAYSDEFFGAVRGLVVAARDE